MTLQRSDQPLNVEYVKEQFARQHGILMAALETIEDSVESAAMALRSIRDGKLYRVRYATFEEYCQQALGHSVNYGQKILRAADNLRAMSTVVLVENLKEPDTQQPLRLPTSESELRELGRLHDAHAQVEVVQQIKERHETVTTTTIRRAVNERLGKPEPPAGETCPACGKVYTYPVWHCAQCGAHPPAGATKCGPCEERKRAERSIAPVTAGQSLAQLAPPVIDVPAPAPAITEPPSLAEDALLISDVLSMMRRLAERDELAVLHAAESTGQMEALETATIALRDWLGEITRR